MNKTIIKRLLSLVLCAALAVVIITAEGEGAVMSFIIRDILPYAVYAESAELKEVIVQVEEESPTREYILFDDTVTDDYAEKNFYILSGRTEFVDGDIDVEAFKNIDLKIDKSSDGPQVLIFHTHSSEMFADSDIEKGLSEGIWGVGEELKRILEEEYGLNVYHDMSRFDVVDGKTNILGSYERMEPEIKKILERYPTIELVIDMHRDGIDDVEKKLITEINGEVCAKIMLFNGLSRLKDGDSLKEIEGLENPYLKENLALSYNIYMAAEEMYPTLMRKIYIEAYRYSLHMKPKSLLVEVGAQNNSKQEAKNSMKYLAKAIAAVCLE